MARHSVNSLKSKIWLATTALAFFVCVFGIGSWLIVSLFTENSFYIVVARILFSSLAILIYGWWLSREVVRPIEKVALLAKSFERGVSTSLPKTSGSAETDELLQTLYRSNQQMLNLVGLMDKVAGGNLDVALTPLQQSDRLSNSFQKLLAKFTESINAKRELERLKTATRQISEEVALVKTGNFAVEIKSDFVPTREISDALKFLIHRLNELVLHVKDDTKAAYSTAKEAHKNIQTNIGADENRILEMNRAKLALRQISPAVKKISEELYASSHTAKQSVEKAHSGTRTAQENLSAAGVLRQQLRETVKRVGRLGERAQEIGKAAKTVEDLANRTNLIALNASIQTAEDGGQAGGFAALTEEIERLAERAAKTDKQISTLNKTIAAEIGEIERALQDSVSEAANLSRYAIETGNSLSEIEKYIGQFLDLQEKLAAFSGAQSVDGEAAFQSFAASIGEAEATLNNLKESETQIAQTIVSMENLQFAVADFKTPVIVVKEISPSDYTGNDDDSSALMVRVI